MQTVEEGRKHRASIWIIGLKVTRYRILSGSGYLGEKPFSKITVYVTCKFYQYFRKFLGRRLG